MRAARAAPPALDCRRPEPHVPLQYETERLSQLAHECFVAIGFFAAQMMVNVQHDELAPEAAGECVRARRNRRRPRPLHPRGPLPAACYNEG